MVDSTSMLTTPATSMTNRDTSTGATNRIAELDMPWDPTGLLRSERIIPGASPRVRSLRVSVSARHGRYRESGHGSCSAISRPVELTAAMACRPRKSHAGCAERVVFRKLDITCPQTREDPVKTAG